MANTNNVGGRGKGSGDGDNSGACAFYLLSFMNNIDILNPQVIDFNIFEKRMANLFKIHKVPDEMKTAILLNKLNNETFKIVHDLVFPEDINTVEYSVLTAKLNN
jgi:hypothetical protein